MNARTFYLFARAFYGFAWSLMITVSLVYMVVDVHLDPLQMVLVGTVLEGTVFLLEIPTGVVADTVSRKLSVVIGHALVGAGFLLMALIPEFWAVLAAQVIWGGGWTFISGAYPAWLSGEIGSGKASETFLRGSQLGHLAAFVGIACAVVLAHVSLALPIVVGAVLVVLLAVLMAVFMQETEFVPLAALERDTWSKLQVTFAAGVTALRARPVLVAMVVIAAIYGAFSEGVDRLFVPLVLDEFVLPSLGPLSEVTWWGIIAAVASMVGFAATTIARRVVKLDDQRGLSRVLGVLVLGMALAVLVVANAGTLYGVLAAFWVLGALRSAYGPLVTGWLNRLLPQESKSTLFSFFGQADAAGQTFGGPVIGVLAKTLTIGFALSVTAFVLLPLAVLYRNLSIKLGNDAKPASTPGSTPEMRDPKEVP